MHNFTGNYDKILEVLKGVSPESENFLSQIRKPKLTDLKIMATSLTSEYMSIDSEHQLFRILPLELKSLIKCSVYNRRIETLFSQLCDQFMIRRNYAKSFLGFKTRILSQITTLTISRP